jgi:hypothetical protein
MLWPIIKKAAIDLQKQEINYLYQKIQVKKAKNIFLPEVRLEGGVSFSGPTYPLTQPSYTLKCSFAFNNGLLPINLSSGLSAKDGRINGAQNSANSSVPSSVTYFTEQKAQDLALAVGTFALADSELALRETLRDTVYAHDNGITELGIQQSMLDILKRRIEIDRVRLETGDLKRMEFLEELMDAAEKETALAETEFRILGAERTLEIAAHIPYGNLWRTFEKI